MRLCITGGPKTGKTTMAAKLYESAEWTDAVVVNCDRLMEDGMDWSGVSQHAAWIMVGGKTPSGETFLPVSDPWIVEGVQVARALRKALAMKPTVKPCDKLIILTKRRDSGPVLNGQEAMRKGLETVLAEIMPDLERLGVVVEGENS